MQELMAKMLKISQLIHAASAGMGMAVAEILAA
jgi:hypothetical protein